MITTFSVAKGVKNNTILIETESFANKGGWVVDPQFMDQMGSPFLLAHGNGKPVANATTQVKFSEKGEYIMWVRTKNWNSPWNENQAPGRFNILINGIKTGTEFGTQPSKWGWIKGGNINILENEITLDLQDLTGFDGRCDAILFTKSKKFTPPNENAEMEKLRSKLLGLKIINEGDFDLVVVGAGMAGLTTSITAARLGLKVALIHNRPLLGGNNSPEQFVVASGGINLLPYTNLGNVVAEIGNVYDDYGKTLKLIQHENNIKLFINMNGNGVEMNGKHINAVYATDIITSKKHKFNCLYIADCTGDANIGFLAGADFMMGRELRSEYNELLAPEVQSNLSLGSTVRWYAKKAETTQSFPLTPWAVNFTEVTAQHTTQGTGWWETGFRYDQIKDFEYIRDYALRVIYGNWSFLKNESKKSSEYSNYNLSHVNYLPGKRESRRLIGDVIFTQNDVENGGKKYNDGCIMATYTLDQHFPTAENTIYFPGEEFISYQKHNFNPLGISRSEIDDKNVNGPFLIPYRCLYSRNIDNLFMAGRDISVTHIVLSSTRVQRTNGMMGEVIGMAAQVCKKNGTNPRGVYTTYFGELKKIMIQKVIAVK